MQIIEFKPWHIDEMIDLGGQEWMRAFFSEHDPKEAYANAGPAFSMTVDGEILACAGLIVWHRYRASAWAFLTQKVKQHFLPGHLAVRDFLRKADYPRIEAFVDTSFEPAMKWVHTLGFKPEGPAKPFWFVDGRSAQEWAIIKEI